MQRELMPVSDERSLFELRRLGVLPPWVQLVAVAGLFVATVLLTHEEYRARGTAFGYAGPAFNSLVNPIYEELIFRGWILGLLLRRRSAWVAVSVSSLLFGLVHLRNIYWTPPAELFRMMAYTGLVLGPILALVTLRCRSVWPAVILHYLNNLSYFTRPGVLSPP